MFLSSLEQCLDQLMLQNADAFGGIDKDEDEGKKLGLDPACFSKDALVEAHELTLAYFTEPLGPYVTDSFFSVGAPEEVRPSAPIRGLRPMLISDLQVGCCHKGRVLFGELCVEPLKMVAVQTVLVDEVGHAANLAVYNARPHQHDAQKMYNLFAKGLKVAIKEPYFKVAMDGSFIIRVDNPADYVCSPNRSPHSQNLHASESSLSSSSSSSSLSSSPSSSSSPNQSRVLLDACELRSQGNKAFAAQDWKHAIQLYSDGIKIILQCPGSSFSRKVSKELVLGFSNRAEARLRLKHFEAALSDASKALQLQRNHAKSTFRRGKALHGLHQYKEAALCFQEVLQMTNDENGVNAKDLASVLEASEMCDRQARTGQFDLLKMWREVEEGREPVCGEYIGPVEIGPARDRTLSRGLFVTRNVKPGDLLLVSKAVAHAKLGPSSMMGLSEEEIVNASTGSNPLSPLSNLYYEDLASQVLDRAVSSKRFREQVNTLSLRDSSGIKSNIPAMDLFVPKPKATGLDDVLDLEDEALDSESIDVEHIQRVTRNNAFEVGDELGARLWLLPSFINHSCLPNACWMTVGKEALFVRAVRHLTKGQEVVISHLDNPAVCLPRRVSFLQRCRGFECRCERCSFEKTMEPFTKQVDRKAVFQPEDTMEAVELVESLEWGFQNIKAFADEKKRQWLRTSYSHSYAWILDNASLQQRLKDIQPLETSLRAVQETLGVSEYFLAAVLQRVHMGGCNPHVKGMIASMFVSLYGRQAPASLRALVALRLSMIAKQGLANLGALLALRDSMIEMVV